MELCEVCGTGNRKTAKFCRGCARALQPVAPGVAALGEASNRALRCGVCKAIHSRSATVCAACGNPLNEARQEPAAVQGRPAAGWRSAWPVWAALALVGVVLGMWALSGSDPVEPSPASPVAARAEVPESGAATSAVQAPLSEVAAETSLETATAPSTMEASMDAAEKAHFEELVKRETERAEKARQSLARLAEQEKARQERMAARAAAARQRVETVPAVASPPAPVETVVPKAAAVAVAPKPVPVAKVSVEEACSHTTNFLSRDWCRVAACREASNAKDPICVWYRQLEEERKLRMQGN